MQIIDKRTPNIPEIQAGTLVLEKDQQLLVIETFNKEYRLVDIKTMKMTPHAFSTRENVDGYCRQRGFEIQGIIPLDQLELHIVNPYTEKPQPTPHFIQTGQGEWCYIVHYFFGTKTAVPNQNPSRIVEIREAQGDIAENEIIKKGLRMIGTYPRTYYAKLAQVILLEGGAEK